MLLKKRKVEQSGEKNDTMTIMIKRKIFAGKTSIGLAEKLARESGGELVRGLTEYFPDGNILVQTGEKVHREEVVVVQTIWGKKASENFLELLFWLDALKRGDAAKITVVIPFFSYAKADKQEEEGLTSLRARVCADCLQVAGANRVLMMDLHSPSIPGFFQIPVENLSAMKVIVDYLKAKNLSDAVIVSPDAGFAKQARKYAAALGWPCAIGDKNRPELNGDAEILEIVGEVKGKKCVVVDDFTTSAGTLVDVARALEERGAAEVYAAVTHAPIDEKALMRIQASPIKELVVTNTTGNEEIFSQSEKIVVLDVMKIFAQNL